jgi:2-amino-4-hydroxy-6-hydroxymethyldihydropteridine diphosphokinase
MPHRAFIGIGTNLGDKAANYREAISRVADLPQTRVLRQSSVYETDPVGDADLKGKPFFNGVIEIDTELPADILMRRLLAIERTMGRRRLPGRKPARRVRYKPRVIDLDLLLFDREVQATSALTLPHPRLHERRFVLSPMAELAPTLVHPKLNVTISNLLAGLKSPQRVTLAHADMLRPRAPRREAASR